MGHPTLHTLDNGFRLITEAMPQSNSVSMVLWMACGSRNEEDSQSGMTHFGEHMIFKGTPSRHWTEISRASNLLGGHINACTSTDWVRLYTTVIHKDLKEGLQLMADMFLHSLFPAKEVERERQVILEEIAQYEDVPEDLVYEKFTQALLLPHPVGRPVIGTEELVSSFSQDELSGFWKDRLAPSRLILSLAGSFDEAPVRRTCEELFGKLNVPEQPLRGMEPVSGCDEVNFYERDLEQINFAFGVTASRKRDPRRFAWVLYDTILGSSTGSRLFDEVRERRGLAYSIGSSLTLMHEAGFLTISGSTRPEYAKTALEVCRQELQKLADDGPTATEMETAKQQLERNLLLSNEHTNVRALVIGERELYHVDQLTAEETLERLHAVTLEEVKEVGKEAASQKPAACVMGPLGDAPGLEDVFQ